MMTLQLHNNSFYGESEEPWFVVDGYPEEVSHKLMLEDFKYLIVIG